MKELSIKEKAKRYDEIIKKANKMHHENCEDCQMRIEELIPELKESEDERIRKAIIDYFKHEREEGIAVLHYGVNIERMIAWLEKQGEFKSSKWTEGDVVRQTVENIPNVKSDKEISNEIIKFLELPHLQFVGKRHQEDWIAWLKKQEKIDKISYEIAEKEKREFVGEGFIKCYADFQDFKEGETYWLEYVGNDNYNVRSDNLLGKTYHITPCQLYTIFKKQTWLEKQGEKDSQITLPQFTFDDILALQCCMETVKKVQEDKDLYKKLEDLHGRVYDGYHLEKKGEQKSIWHNEDEEPQRGSLILLIMQSGTPIVAKIIEPNHTFNHGERWAYIKDLIEKQDKQKPTDKVEPKFKKE